MGFLTDGPLSWLAPAGPYFLPFAVILLALYFLSTKYDRNISDIPGPFWAGFSNIWRTLDTYKGRSQYTAIALHRQYGPLVRVGPKHISVGDPAAIKTIYAINNGFTKTAFYPIQAARYDKKPMMNLFATRDETYHSRIKRPVAHSYSMATLVELEPKIDHVSKIFMRKLMESASDNRLIDLGEWLQWYAFDVIINLTFSQTPGFLEELRDVDNMISSIGAFFLYAAVIGQVPWLHKLLAGNPLLPVVMPAIETFNPAVMFANKCMNEMKTGDTAKGRDDFLMRFQQLVENGTRGGMDGGAFKAADIVNHTSTNVLAGSDTTAIALRSIIHNVITTPICYSRLLAEIDEWNDAGRLSDPVKESEARQMPYLQAVIKEAMRLHPSVGMLMERHVPKGGSTICGKFIPEGYVVGINPWVAGRDKGVYGEDADEFHPERWLDAGEDQLKQMERTSLAFGAGSRICIGKNISMMEMSKVIPQLFREFDITLAAPRKDLEILNYW
ncbi:cytochrome P450 [Aspergillus karnatakaensis]|uniref:cytochrome P450 n=1 Tax=Aspergillus karnatakaensis TaxID=1810916 RepID=UPI003CCD4002